MITAIVSYTLPDAVPRETVQELFKASAPRFLSAHGLTRKYYCYDAESGAGQSIYLFETRAAAEALLNADFAAQFEDKFGTKPQIAFHDTLMVVDTGAQSATTF